MGWVSSGWRWARPRRWSKWDHRFCRLCRLWHRRIWLLHSHEQWGGLWQSTPRSTGLADLEAAGDRTVNRVQVVVALILIASNTRIDVRGTILAASPVRYISVGSIPYGFGSGGAIRLAAPVVAGAGTLNASGGKDTSSEGGTSLSIGGAGRIRIDCMDHRWLALDYFPAAVASIGANMVAIPSNPPRLDITQIGTTNIPVGTTSPVFFYLTQDSSTNQTVTV